MRTEEEVRLEIEKLQKELEDIKSAQLMYKPERGEFYFFIGSSNCVNNQPYDEDDVDEELRTVFNCFETEEKAKRVADRTLFMRAQMAWNEKFDNGYEFVDGNDNFCIVYDEVFYVRYVNGVKHPNSIYFSSEDKAQNCLNWLKKIGLIGEK